MVGAPASATNRRDKGGQTATSLANPRNGITTNKAASNGRITPVRIRNGDSNFVNANAAWGFETPTNKILSNVPSTVTIRSSERRRRLKPDGNDELITGDKSLGTAFVDSRFTDVRTPTPEPRMLERSSSNASAKSEHGFQPRKLAKVSSFCSDRPITTPLQPTIKKENFFHAKDYKEKRPPPGESSEKFFYASSKTKNAQPIAPINTSHQRRLSTSSQYSSFSTAKEACPSNSSQYTIPPPVNPPHQPRSPVSPTKTTFFHASNPTTPASPLAATLQTNVLSSPLRSSFVTRTPSPPPVQTINLSPKQLSLKQTPLHDSQESTLSSSNSSAQVELSSDTSEDDLTTKSLLPSTADLENSARINRKIADLEISNSSLLAVNKNLERITREQSIEIKSLRKQLRQSLRVSTIGPRPVSPIEDSEDEEEQDDEEMDDGDLDFRMSLDKSIFLTEQMLVAARKGLDYRVRTSELLTGRVLSGEWKEGML